MHSLISTHGVILYLTFPYTSQQVGVWSVSFALLTTASVHFFFTPASNYGSRPKHPPRPHSCSMFAPVVHAATSPLTISSSVILPLTSTSGFLVVYVTPISSPPIPTTLTQDPSPAYSTASPAPNTKGFCCYNLESGGVIISRHVCFDESVFPFKQVSGLSPAPQITPLVL